MTIMVAVGGFWSSRSASHADSHYSLIAGNFMNDQALTESTQGSAGLSGFLKACFSELRYNIKRSGRNIVFDAMVLFACFVLFESNNLLIKPWISSMPSGGMIETIILYHANDLLGGIAFMAYTNGLLDLVKPDVRFKGLLVTLLFMLFCGLFWEVAAPHFVPGSTGDLLDIAAYLLGAWFYWGLNMIKDVY